MAEAAEGIAREDSPNRQTATLAMAVSDGMEATNSDLKDGNIGILKGPLPYGGPIALPYPSWNNSFGNEVEVEKHIRDANAVQGSCGLYNLGNICFMNAGLQCLLANSNFMKFFLDDYQPIEHYETLTAKFAELCRMVWSSNYVQIHPKFFKETLGNYHPQFQNSRQHDCQEFLALILDDLHEELNQAKLNRFGNVFATFGEKPASEKVTEVSVLPPEEDSQDILEVTANQSDITEGEERSSHSHSVSPVEHQCISEESNQSGEVATRFKALPQNVQGFKTGTVVEESLAKAKEQEEDLSTFCKMLRKGSESPPEVNEKAVNINTSLGISAATDHNKESDSFKFERNFTCVPSTSGQNLNIHSIETFYMKDTKTKNVNVLATEFMEEEIKTDSEKFPRQETVAPNSVDLMDEMIDIDMYQESAKGDSYKETNENINVLPVERKNSEKGGLHRKNLKCELDPDETSINNIKRIKIDEDQKNFKLEQLKKVNTDKNQCVTTSPHHSNVDDVACCSTPVADAGATYQGPMWQALMEKEANKEWEKYTERNWSIIVDTFQGQYRNMVVCQACQHVSVTYEPFMYLTVPLPHAMEKQICVTFKYNKPRPPTRFLVTVNKSGNIGKLRQELMSLVRKDGVEGEVVLAEVYENHISRVLEDHFLIRYLRERRTVYAFEMGPAPATEDSATSTDIDTNKTITTMKNDISSGCQIAGPMGTSLDDNDDDLFTFEENRSNKDPNEEDGDYTDMTPLFQDSDDENARRRENDNLLLNNMTVSSTDVSMGTYEIGYWNNDVGTSADYSGGASTDVGAGCSATADQWKSCTICLEEMTDSDLMVHTSCGGTLCQSCLDMSIKHYGEMAFSCPVCSLTVDPTEEFVPLSSGYKPKIRILTIPVVFRYDHTEEDGLVKSDLFGHPALQYFPNCMTGEELRALVNPLVPFKAEYKILFVDGQGLHCSRCLYHEHCRGCTVDLESDVNILPGDHLALSFADIPVELRDLASHVTDDESLVSLRPNQTLTLYDCLRAFTQSEVLDEHNPWFCPRCRMNQRANKTISLWRYPDWVIIYLKRFVFHDLSSSKIDNKVSFPLENLDLHDYLSGPANKELLYDLKGCVCHFGGVNSGHYTAYTKHPVTDTWHYYNDEAVTLQEPQSEDYGNAYILFYQRKGSGVDLSKSEKRFMEAPETANNLPGTIYLNDDQPGHANLDFYS
ncbi:uncharacterized protein LOC135494727 isoform X2 [Lineus longissimus]